MPGFDDAETPYAFSVVIVVDTEPEAPAGAVAVVGPYPNPVGAAPLRLDLTLPAALDVRVRVYDVLGRVVARLHEGRLPAGPHTVRWERANAAAGLYVVEVEAGAYRTTRKVTLVR